MGIVHNWCNKYTFITLLLFWLASDLKAQVDIYPPFWWSDMKNDTLHLIIKNNRDLKKKPEFSEGLAKVLSVEIAANPKYSFATLLINRNPKDSVLKIKVGRNKVKYLIKKRKERKRRSLDQRDVMYLISPDRFANGDPSNDKVKGMKERVYSRDSIYGRHGGDIQGIIDHLGFINNMGINSLWICPLLTNDMPEASYHGYAITDNYSIDPRFGTNELYRNLVDSLHSRNMTMVMDMVYNHVGTMHHLFQDLPDSNFFNFHDGYDGGFLQTNYRAVTLFDPHASEADLKRFNDGWFVKTMPDVNQRYKPMAEFMIQNSIWWIEEFGVDAFRIDTYTYPDQKFMGELAKRVKAEYPQFFIFGETWVHGPEIQSYFVEKNRYNPVNSHMDAVTDFQFAFAMHEALNKNQGWTEGIAKVYYRLAADYLYDYPEKHVTFLDNHDLARIFGTVNGDLKKMEIALGMLFTMRGIPCMYYGTEVLMKETANHGVIREDFAGGWPEDKINKFQEEGRSEDENYIHDYITKVLKWRSGSKAVTQGKMKHFVPDNGVYVFFRYTNDEVVMVVTNTHQEPSEKELDLSRFREIWPINATGTNVLTGETINSGKIKLAPMSLSIYKLQN